MPLQTLDLKAVGAFPKLFLDYITKNETLTSFYNQYPDIEGFRKAIQSRAFTQEKRQTLVSVLEKQYANLDSKPDFSLLLDDKTFTVTTGHQLNIFTGPLYVIYKIVTIINLAKQLKDAFPDYNFVPVYWMASEDHDFDEISVFNLFGKNYKWETTQKGAVGRMNPKELRAICDQIPERVEFFQNAYLNHDTLANAVRCYMSHLFQDQGLICLDADSADLKALFAPVMKDDILQHSASHIVKSTSDQLQALGYHTQITPREINFFYLEDSTRERIVKEDNQYKVLHTDIRFSEAEILQLIGTNPERFSPNVVLRPLYQETILPNLAYIGGPSEVPYWLQLKGVFDHYQESFPLLMPRNFALVVNEASRKKIDKLGITTEELFADEVTLRKSFVEKNSRKSLSLAFEIDEINDIFERILKKATIIEATMKGPVEGVKAKSINALEHLEKRIKRAEERNQESSVSQLLALKERLFPGGGLQERKENFLNFYLNDHQFIQKLLDSLAPLDYKFNIIEI
ncbi:bacillithiol biosynthesis cysteine-adding enzyme BshC [Emticicia sp. TH156]|uniref:bacillithiol biosynthesis cysteine-adding enzyme BshC n=1 Tax=Emticicia sp. TH156 TaxID=2067454 RepID=UPI000C757230|nr:bacillithiol biosynthesis cysteine-adding enzyme BshC [Emticicia sp. TH156]PLK46315.1 bacillithiol biosynthesis cysteine-adding enzyme BshC [Emticicia sp. TH156]